MLSVWRGYRLRLGQISDRIDRRGGQETAGKRAQPGLQHNEAWCGGLRAREDIASRSRDSNAQRLARSADQHREPLESIALRGVSRLTTGACAPEKESGA